MQDSIFEEKCITISVAVPYKLIVEFQKIADKKGLTRSAVIQKLMRAYCAKNREVNTYEEENEG